MAKKNEDESAQLGNAPIATAPATRERTGGVAGDYVDGRLTRAGMERAIRNGGSVAYAGKIIARVDDLPDESDLATTETEVDAALESVDRQIEALKARKSKLETAAKADKK